MCFNQSILFIALWFGCLLPLRLESPPSPNVVLDAFSNEWFLPIDELSVDTIHPTVCSRKSSGSSPDSATIKP